MLSVCSRCWTPALPASNVGRWCCQRPILADVGSRFKARILFRLLFSTFFRFLGLLQPQCMLSTPLFGFRTPLCLVFRTLPCFPRFASFLAPLHGFPCPFCIAFCLLHRFPCLALLFCIFAPFSAPALLYRLYVACIAWFPHSFALPLASALGL